MLPSLLLALQVGGAATPPVVSSYARDSAARQSPPATSTMPEAGDTTGYWQQRVRYVIGARLDEARQVLVATGRLTYVNASPDTLRELWVHQYLNAFRPGSKWSRADARERRVRFQHLAEPAYGYERFTSAPRVDGVAVTPRYPGAPDSTVAVLALPRPLAPGDSLAVDFAWEARPSTTPRRQGRRGRSYDFAQWFPKVAVYDRLGWEPNALVPAGEFYGEFGEYDVTLVVKKDQVIGSTGVPVEGDPGWESVRRWGAPRLARDAYAATGAGAPVPALAPDEKAVRWVARDVHHFAFSVSPDYRYEGGVYARGAVPGDWTRWRPWDTVPVHVLYRPGDEAQWGNGQAVQRTITALQWLERTYGPYAYPQMTNLHRLDGGGTEFPMMMMNGSASQGLVLHEGGHIFTYGILANNEWRAGWMDEGLTSYQTSWAQRLTRHDRVDGGEPTREAGYRGRALRPTGPDAPSLPLWQLEVTGRAEPIGTRADRFNEFGVYNAMIYDRGETMYGALRDAIGDTAFRSFLRGYYARWGLKHVDEAAMRGEAERAAGRDLGWFFDQWVHRVGLVDYALVDVDTRREGSEWVTRARIRRRGDYRHPMPVGARTASGWTIVRGDALRDAQTVEIRTAERPTDVRLDPLRTTEDWYRPNDVRRRGWTLSDPRAERLVLDWPLLEQRSADRIVTAIGPLAWYGEPGRLAAGVRARSNYRGLANRGELGIALYSRAPEVDPDCGLLVRDCARGALDALDARVQLYTTVENPRLFGGGPVMGLRAGAYHLDGIDMLDVRRTWDQRQFAYARGPLATTTLFARATSPYARDFLAPDRWSGLWAADAGVAMTWQGALPAAGTAAWRRAFRIELSAGVREELADAAESLGERAFGVGQLEATAVRRSATSRFMTAARGFVGATTDRTPRERAIFAGTRNPTETFANHFVRPRDGLLSHPEVPFLVPGGAGLRGYDARLAIRRVAAVNLEQGVRLRQLGHGARPWLWATAFADGATSLDEPGFDDALADAGVGLALRGPLFDREVRLRLELPLWLNRPAFAIGEQERGSRTAVRIGIAASELW